MKIIKNYELEFQFTSIYEFCYLVHSEGDSPLTCSLISSFDLNIRSKSLFWNQQISKLIKSILKKRNKVQNIPCTEVSCTARNLFMNSRGWSKCHEVCKLQLWQSPIKKLNFLPDVFGSASGGGGIPPTLCISVYFVIVLSINDEQMKCNHDASAIIHCHQNRELPFGWMTLINIVIQNGAYTFERLRGEYHDILKYYLLLYFSAHYYKTHWVCA